MKKFFVIILSVVYLTATLGITVHRHYCMNRFVGWSLTDRSGDLCGRCGMDKSEKDNGCCKDEQIKLKIGDDQQPSFMAPLFHHPQPAVISPAVFNTVLIRMAATHEYVFDHGPPYTTTLPVFLLNRVVRI